jgi:hypothetical protein
MFEQPVHTVQPSFARGEVSPFLFGRVDTTAYSAGLRQLRNAFVRPEGAVSNRQGFAITGNSLSNTSKATTLLPFVFSTTQSYVIEVGVGSAQVFSGGAIVVGASFATPWAQSALSQLRYSQSADTLTVVHPLYPPYEIKRTSANSFTCQPATYTQGPFLAQNTDGVTFVYASAKTGTVTLTANASIFNANQVGSLMQLTQQDLSPIPPWEPGKVFTNAAGTGINPVGLYRRASLKNYLCVAILNANSSNPPYATGTIIPSHSQGIALDGDGSAVPNLAGSCGVQWEYQDSGYGVVLITGYISPTQVTGVVQPNYLGGPGLLPISVVGGPTVAFGPFTFSGNGSTTAFSPLTGVTTTDPTKFIVTVNGVYQGQSTYSISGTTITFLTAPPAGTNNIVVSQISSLGQTSYWAFGAFSVDQGYPSAVSYFPDRLIMAATTKQPVGVFGSQTSQYHSFQVNNPVLASDAFTVFLNARQLNAISDLIPLSDLLVGTSNIIWRLWPGSTGTALGPLAIAATPQSYYGAAPTCASILFGDSAIFAEYDGRRLRDLIYQFAYDKFLGQELTLYSRHLIPYGTQFQRLAYKPDAAAQFIFGLRTDGVLLCCTYLREQQITGWAHWDTQGTFEDILVVPENTAFALYAITNRTINGAQVRYIERLTSREVTTVFDYKFLDCCSTYDGRNTSTTTMTLTGGSTWLAGDTGTVTASSGAGWTNFVGTDASNNNEIWLFGTLAFTASVGSMQSGVLKTPVVPGTYPLMFQDGEARTVTVAIDGVTCTWTGPLMAGQLTSATYRCRLLLTSITSATQATVRLKDPCPTFLQSAATVVWTFARTVLSGATQLAGMQAVALVDANVYGITATGTAPSGILTVSSSGGITLPVAGGVVQVGLPYISDFETLALNEQGQETIRMRAKTNPVIYLDVTETRNFLAGTDFTTISPNVERAFEAYVSPTSLQMGVQWTRVASELTSECHTCIRQNMPLPITIRMHIPQITIGEPIS